MVDDPVWNVCPGFPEGGVYRGMNEVYGAFYPKLFSRFYYFDAIPDVFVDGGNVVLRNEGEPNKLVRFAQHGALTLMAV